MEAYVDPRFRPTLWPGTIVPTPPLHPMPDVEVDGDWIVWTFAERIRQRDEPPRQLPDDFYLRELIEVAPDDLDGAAALFRNYGLLFDLERRELDLVNDPEERDRLAAIADVPPDDGSLRGGVHRELVKAHLETAHQSLRTWLACQRPNGLEELVEPEANEATLAQWREQNPDNEYIATKMDLDDVRRWLIQFELDDLEHALRAALSKFSVGPGDLADRRPTIYSVSFLQMYNHLAEQATVRRCASETCQRHFVRQRGRAEYGQFRTSGVKYCSRECARAQAQRELRRRRKHEDTPQLPVDRG